MSRQYRIRIYGTQRQNIDPALLAQVVILFGRHLHQQRHHQHNHQTARNVTTRQDRASAGDHGESDVVHPEPPPGETPATPRINEGELS